MDKLLKADLYRIVKSKLFLIICIITGALPILTVLLYKGVELLSSAVSDFADIGGLVLSGRQLIGESFILSSNMGLILPIFITIFVAMDISNGTLRNKIIAGRSRTAIYFSHLISACAVSGVLILVNVAIFFCLTCLVFGYGTPINQAELVRIVYFLVTGLFTFFFSASVSTAITLSIKSSAPAVIISVLIGMGLSIVASLVHTADPTLTNKWFCLIPTYTNTAFLAAGRFPAEAFWLGLLSLIVSCGLMTVLGLFIFKKNDVK